MGIHIGGLQPPTPEEMLVHPEQFGVKPELVVIDIVSKIFTAPGHQGMLIAVPKWKIKNVAGAQAGLY